MAKIFLDPGHGGHDSGAVGSRSYEKNNVLKVALKLGDYLKKMGHTIKYSRSSDVYLTLTQRTNMANSWGADIFISLHNDSAVNKSATGFETFIYNGSVSARTKQLQRHVHNEIAKSISIRDRGVKRANLAVCRQSKMPAVLIEYAFISNKSDEDILINEVDKLALLTANGIASFYGQKKIEQEGLTVAQAKALQKQIDDLKKENASLKKQLANKLDKPSNQKVSDWATEDWNRAVSHGYFDGTNPKNPLTREQAAKVVNSLVDNLRKYDIEPLEDKIKEIEKRALN